MLICEIADPGAQKLTALVALLTGRARDDSGPQEISKTAFISMANSLGVAVTLDSLPQLLAQLGDLLPTSLSLTLLQIRVETLVNLELSASNTDTT